MQSNMVTTLGICLKKIYCFNRYRLLVQKCSSFEVFINQQHQNDQTESQTNSNLTGKKKKPVVATAKGTRDYHPHQMILRANVLNSIVNCFKRHGAQELDTPVFELKKFLDDENNEVEKLIFTVSDHGRELLGLRYDLTIPFARYLAQNQITNYKRYQVGKVYRRDEPTFAKARLREFIQCDFDIAGDYDSMIPDAECVKILCEVFSDLQLENFNIRINHRGLLEGLLATCQVPPQLFSTVCKSIDKLDKISWNDVASELRAVARLEPKVIDKIHHFLKETGKIDLLKKLLEDSSLMQQTSSKQGLEDLQLLFHYLDLYSVLNKVTLDLSLARGLEYYTGLIYEVCLNDFTEIGSVAGGGRYDHLVETLDPKQRTVPCVGLSIGFERICFILENKLKILKNPIQTCETEVLVASAQKNFLEERMRLCQELWDAKIKTEQPYKKNPKLLNQLQYCEQNNIPLAIIIGDEEMQKNVVKIRHVTTRKEVEVSRDQMVAEIKKYLNQFQIS